ncbi:unnamed protein product [Auanema sp. JU1783]|nr:unnamed protein product [Auanema sp. JU1783]
MSHDQKYYAIGLTSKVALVYNTENFELVRGFRVPKAPTSMVFDRANEYVIIGDRAGHVCRYKITEPINVNHKDITGEVCGHEGEPLTGVISMVLDVGVSTDGKYVLFADRDEKIRISRYPQAFVTEAYCLGHTEYVRSFTVADDALYSSGGDSMLIRWNMLNGSCMRRLQTKVSDSDPVRKLVSYKKEESVFIYAITEGEKNIYVHEDDGSQILPRGSVCLDDIVVDICLNGDHILAVTRSSVTKIDLSSSNTSRVTITDELKNELMNTKDPIGSYFKKVTHKNLEDYQKRKAQRIESEKEKKKKRKEEKKAKEVETTEAADN